MTKALTARQEAEAVEQFGEDLDRLLKRLDRMFLGFSPRTIDRLNFIPHAEHLDEIAEAYRKLGADLCRECDEVEDATQPSLPSDGEASKAAQPLRATDDEYLGSRAAIARAEGRTNG